MTSNLIVMVASCAWGQVYPWCDTMVFIDSRTRQTRLLNVFSVSIYSVSQHWFSVFSGNSWDKLVFHRWHYVRIRLHSDTYTVWKRITWCSSPINSFANDNNITIFWFQEEVFILFWLRFIGDYTLIINRLSYS